MVLPVVKSGLMPFALYLGKRTVTIASGHPERIYWTTKSQGKGRSPTIGPTLSSLQKVPPDVN